MPNKTLVFVHGRNFKPPKAKLKKLWIDAMRWGIERDSPNKLGKFDKLNLVFAYYGDLSQRFLLASGCEPIGGKLDDTASRRVSLDDLKKIPATKFTKSVYKRLPGKNAAKEAVADVIGDVAALFRISDPLIGAVAPDVREYWNEETAFGSDVRERLTLPLAQAMRDRDSVMLISHSLGTMIAWDVLWKFSHYSEYRDIRGQKIDMLVTLGSPLGDETVKRCLKGSRAGGLRRYPTNISRWENLAAEDDFISHDQTVKGDYKAMVRHGLTRSIEDHRIYNLAVRHGKSNPHSSVGYLVHPQLAKLISAWL